MAKRITNEDILKINQLYLKIKTYAGVAREMEIAPSTVKKYVDPNFTDRIILSDEKKEEMAENLRNIMDKDIYFTKEDLEKRKNLDLSYEEYKGIKKLWKELEL